MYSKVLKCKLLNKFSLLCLSLYALSVVQKFQTSVTHTVRYTTHVKHIAFEHKYFVLYSSDLCARQDIRLATMSTLASRGFLLMIGTVLSVNAFSLEHFIDPLLSMSYPPY